MMPGMREDGLGCPVSAFTFWVRCSSRHFIVLGVLTSISNGNGGSIVKLMVEVRPVSQTFSAWNSRRKSAERYEVEANRDDFGTVIRHHHAREENSLWIAVDQITHAFTHFFEHSLQLRQFLQSHGWRIVDRIDDDRGGLDHSVEGRRLAADGGIRRA